MSPRNFARVYIAKRNRTPSHRANTGSAFRGHMNRELPRELTSDGRVDVGKAYTFVIP
jgi:hypothetical protein